MSKPDEKVAAITHDAAGIHGTCTCHLTPEGARVTIDESKFAAGNGLIIDGGNTCH